VDSCDGGQNKHTSCDKLCQAVPICKSLKIPEILVVLGSVCSRIVHFMIFRSRMGLFWISSRIVHFMIFRSRMGLFWISSRIVHFMIFHSRMGLFWITHSRVK
jgi:hypothetical protein